MANTRKLIIAGRVAVSERFIARRLGLDLWENHYLLEDPDETRTFSGLAWADSAPRVPPCLRGRI